MNKLRVGVILPDEKVPAWIARMLTSIKDSSHAEVTAMAFEYPSGGGDGPADRLYSIHFQADRRIFRSISDPWELEDVRKILHNTQLLGENLDERISRLKALRLDVLINFSLQDLPRSLPRPFLDIARFGIWSLQCNDRRVIADTRFGWLEILQDESLLRCSVESYRRDNTQIVIESVMAVHPYSFTHNQGLFLWRASDILPRALKQLHSMGEKEFFSRARSANPPARYPEPTTPQLFTLAWKQVVNWFENRLQRHNSVLMTGVHPEGGWFNWDALKSHEPPRGINWSDPFILKKQNTSYIFFEEYIQAKKRGRISCAVVESDGNISEPIVVLERPYSLSYPFVFEYRGEFYTIPTTQNKAVEVYRCKRFPDQWEHHKTLLQNVNAVNATLFEYSMRWWMFTGVGDELHLFYADDPLSETWTPHPTNPIVSDVRSAHPAGRIFRRDGGLVRSARDTSLSPGRAVSFYRITKLTTNEYEEELLERIEPPDGALAVNTYNNSGELVVLDVQLKG